MVYGSARVYPRNETLLDKSDTKTKSVRGVIGTYSYAKVMICPLGGGLTTIPGMT